MIFAFLPRCFQSGTPEFMSHHQLLLPGVTSQQRPVQLLKPFTEGNRLRTGGTTFTDTPRPETLRRSSTWTGLCIMHISLLFGIFQKNFKRKNKEIKILSRKVSFKHKSNGKAFMSEWYSLSPFIFNNWASSHSQIFLPLPMFLVSLDPWYIFLPMDQSATSFFHPSWMGKYLPLRTQV